MRNAILVSVIAAMLAAGSSVFAGAPINGTYKSTNGDFSEGTEASSWAGAGFLGLGNILYAESNDAANDWIIGCPMVVSVLDIGAPLNGLGNGNKTYLITYDGGYLQLGGPGTPWDGGDASYNGIVDYYSEIRTTQYVNFQIVGSVSDHNVNAHIQGYPASCVTWGIGNGVLLGSTPALSGALQSVKPAGYPAFHDAACNANGATGHWGDIRDLTISITGCAVAIQQSTWGEVKSLYRK